MNKQQELQTVLFQKIKDVLPPSEPLVNEIAETLHITIDSSYRRIRGQKALVLEEIFLLSKKFNISMDEIFNVKTSGDSFLCTVIETKDIGFVQYLKNLHENLVHIQALNNPEIIYFAKDIPIFHHFLFPKLAAFKIFFWSKTLMQLPEYVTRKFNLKEIEDDALEMGKRTLNLYSKIPSVEIWNEETVNSAMRQIEYYLTSGIITNKEDALTLCDDFNALLDHIRQQAEQGCKFLVGTAPCFPNNYKLYNNEVILGDNSICVVSDSLKFTFITFNVLSLMVSNEKSFCEKVENYLRTMMKKSTLISKDSEKERTRFFNLMHKRVNNTMEKVKHI